MLQIHSFGAEFHYSVVDSNIFIKQCLGAHRSQWSTPYCAPANGDVEK